MRGILDLSKCNMFTLMARWFEEITPSQNYQRFDYVVLWLIVGVGTVLRFWGLDNVGLHGDEETMAMPAMAILEIGQPVLPSGMYYARALINVYLMSWSVWIFGESEWAFRLPSAIVGSVAGLAAFFAGRRFLSPQFNLAFVATITLLPGMIEISQTARMYVFFVTCMIWFAACLFRWERDQKVRSLILTLLVWLLCLHFHTLAIFAAPLFLFPGLTRQSWTQLTQGTCAFIFGGILFRLYSDWILSKYPGIAERPPTADVDTQLTALDALVSGNSWLLLISVVAIVAVILVLLVKSFDRTDWTRILPISLLGSGLLAIALLHYHIGGILILLGIVFWVRSPSLPRTWLLVPIVLAVIATVAHLVFFHKTGLYPGRKLIGALIGTPSIWPTLRFMEYSPFAGALYVVSLVYVFALFAKGRRLPINILFFAMAVWAPLLILGYFAWDTPPRYAQGQLGFFLLSVFACVAYIARERNWTSEKVRLSRSALAGLVLICVMIINPVDLWRKVNPGYDIYPDHKGAAEFILTQNLNADAVLIAEDVLQQTYYLGKVDYWLRESGNSYSYSVVQDGRVVDQYTGAVTLGTGNEFIDVLDHNSGKDVFVIGSGENFVNGKRLFRGQGIADVLESDRLTIIYTGRDSKTKIWKLVH